MKKSDKPYRFRDRSGSGRNIEVMFRHIPGRWISTGTRDMVEAIKYAEHFLEVDGIVAAKVPLMKDFAKDFFMREDSASIRYRHRALGKERRPRWYHENQWIVDDYIIPHFGGYLVDSISQVAIENWITTMSGTRRDRLAGATRLKVLNTMRLVMDDVVRAGYLISNPARAAAGPSDATENGRRALSLWEEQKLFPASEDERISVWGDTVWATYFSVLYDTGFRPCEVAGLRVCDVFRTPQGYAVYTEHTMNTEQHKPLDRVKTSGKGMSKRVGLVSDLTGGMILRLVREDGLEGSDYLFMLHRAKDDWRKPSYIFNSQSTKKFAQVVSGFGFEGLHQYCIRHTYITYRRGGMDERILALSTGHAKGVRDDYDHRDAAILISQLESQRDALTKPQEIPDIVPITKEA